MVCLHAVCGTADAHPGGAAGHGQRPDEGQEEVPGNRADGPGCSGESRRGSQVDPLASTISLMTCSCNSSQQAHCCAVNMLVILPPDILRDLPS